MFTRDYLLNESSKIQNAFETSKTYGEFCQKMDEAYSDPKKYSRVRLFSTEEIRNQKPEKKYAYFITFTQDPKKKYFNKLEYIENRILKLLSGKQANAKYCAYVREGGDEEHKHIHWHVLLESHSFVKKKDLIKNYVAQIGAVDFQTKFYYDYTKTLNYISKQCSFKILFDGVFETYLTKNPTTMRCDKYIHLSEMPHVDFPTT